MKKQFVFMFLLFVPFLVSCTSGPMRAPTSAGMVVLAKGATQHTATVMLTIGPTRVYETMLSIVEARPDWKLINDNRDAHLIEVQKGELNLTAQATTMDRVSTILFIWADAGNSGMTGYDLAKKAMQTVCDELKVECQMQDI